MTTHKLPLGESGHYHHNIVCARPDGDVLVRTPIADAQYMDLRIWPEHLILRAVERVANVPRVIEVSRHPDFQLHSVVAGDRLDRLAPPAQPVPSYVVEDLVGLMRRLVSVDLSALPSLPSTWPTDGHCAAFADVIADNTASVFDRLWHTHGDLYEEFRLPRDTVDRCRDWTRIGSRPFGLLHCDLHRQNIFVSRARCAFIDWELALWGDPVYELASHLHKMAYSPGQEAKFVSRWAHRLPGAYTRGWESALLRYRRGETTKSALVDTVRVCDQLRAGVDEASERRLSSALADKLNAAYNILGVRYSVSPEHVLNVALG